MELFIGILPDYVAIIILIIIYIYSKTQFSRDVASNRLFNLMICNQMAFSVFDIIATHTVANAAKLPIWVNYLFLSLYFLTEATTIIIFFKYVEKYINANVPNTVMYYVSTYLPAFFVVECLVANCFVFILFECDKHGDVSYGPLFPIMYFILAYYYAMILFKLFRNRKRISRRQCFAVICFIGFSVIMMLLQVLVLPGIYLQAIGFAIASLILMLRLETPDYQKLESALKSLEIAREQADKLTSVKRLFISDKRHFVAASEYTYRTVINDIYYNYRQKALGKRIDIQMETDDSVPETVLGDRGLLWQLVNDFLSNAIDNTRRGTITINSTIDNVNGENFDIVINIVSSNTFLSLNSFLLSSNDIRLEMLKNEDGSERMIIKLPHTLPKS